MKPQLSKTEREQVLNFYWLTGIDKKSLAKLFKVSEEEILTVVNNRENGRN